jgi:hypothetical protein
MLWVVNCYASMRLTDCTASASCAVLAGMLRWYKPSMSACNSYTLAPSQINQFIEAVINQSILFGTLAGKNNALFGSMRWEELEINLIIKQERYWFQFMDPNSQYNCTLLCTEEVYTMQRIEWEYEFSSGRRLDSTRTGVPLFLGSGGEAGFIAKPCTLPLFDPRSYHLNYVHNTSK